MDCSELKSMYLLSAPHRLIFVKGHVLYTILSFGSNKLHFAVSANMGYGFICFSGP